MSVSDTCFRSSFPQFTDSAKYPGAMLELWRNWAVAQVNADRWGELTDQAVMLVMAHFITMEGRAGVVGASGSPGVLTSKSAQGVSASYDMSSVTEKDAGHWNSTVYGTRYYRMARMIGAGPLQVGIPSPDVGVSGFWPGVIPPMF